MPQLVPEVSDPPHWFCNEKSAAFGPDTVTPLMLSVALPELLRVNDWLLLALPTIWLAKLKLDGATEATGAAPVPLSATDSGLPAASVVMVTTAFRIPAAAGLKITLTLQLCPGLSDPPQPFCKEKSALLGPVKAALLIVNTALPGLLSEKDWALLEVPTIWPAKVRFDADNEAKGAVPVPVSATDWGLSTALSVIFTAPTKIPVAAGAKLTEIVQLAPAPSDAGQLLVTEKSPVASMLLIWSGAFPELFRVKLCGELVVFTRWLPKARLEVERPATGLATPVPVKLTVCGLG